MPNFTKIYLSFGLLFVLWTNAIGAPIERSLHRDKPHKSSQYEVLDIVFETKTLPDNPFIADFSAILTGPNGKTLEVPGFYDGDHQWILRFSASDTGTWRYKTKSSLKELNGHSGTIKISQGDPDKHGAIVIDPENPKKLSYEDGTPYFLSGFECDWLFALDYENAEAAPKTTHLLDLLAENGINQIVTTLYSYDTRWEVDERLKQHPEHDFAKRNDIYPFLGTNADPDFSALNPTFFQRFDRITQLMHERNIVNHLMIYVWNKKVSWPKTESEADDMFFDYVIKRYQAFPNIIWDAAKEAARRPEPYVVERVNRIDPLDAYDRLVTVHDYSYCKNHPETVDIISTQDWRNTLHSEMLRHYENYDKPIFNIEHGGYEESPYVVFPGDYTSAEECLRRNYLCYFAGVYANYYWQGAAWNALIYNPFEQPESFIKPKFEYYKYMETFFTSINYNRFYPHNRGSHSGYCLKSDHGVYLLFIPKENHQFSTYGKDPVTAKKGTYRWFNCFTGEYSDTKKFNGGHLKSPWSGKADSILIRNTR